MAHKPFIAPRWLASSHLQTLAAALPLWAPPRSFQPAAIETLRIPLPAGGALHASAWWQSSASEARPTQEGRTGGGGVPTAVIVHGVGGSSNSRYVVRAAVSLHRAGWHVLRLDLRGVGDSVADAPNLYHAGLTDDLRIAIGHVAALPRVGNIALVGFSLGGHVALRFAGELGDSDPERLRAVVAISAPLDLSEVTRAFERWRCLPYHRYVLRNLVLQALAFARMHPRRAHYDTGSLSILRTIRAYDALVIAPMHGFASAEDYYERASAGPFIERIRVPTLLVHSEDDPMVPAVTVRAWLGNCPAAVEQAWTQHGGHVGWFGGLSESRWVDTWAMERTHAFLKVAMRR
jgi:predicted alpha/beta-fold hydrolase